MTNGVGTRGNRYVICRSHLSQPFVTAICLGICRTHTKKPLVGRPTAYKTVSYLPTLATELCGCVSG
jgi:hypothetical protein